MNFIAHWEYDWYRTHVAEEANIKRQLAARGKDGWELVAVLKVSEYYAHFYFKRRTYAEPEPFPFCP